MILAASGRVIVTGMGKSGHVGRKLAATLASTGTPAHYVHPAEASHGDLGMIGHDDVIVALSWSGETAELRDLIEYARRYQVKLVAITSRSESALARAADVPLVMPVVQEACPHNLAPTTSTLLQLALGDALAVALLEGKGFSPVDFKSLHPGGKLGAQLRFVRDLMHGADRVPLIGLGEQMGNALVEITAKGFGCVGVLDDDGRLVGIITDGDLRRHMCDNLPAHAVAEVMTRGPRTIGPDHLAADALAMLSEGGISSLFVLVEGRPAGIVHLQDLLRAGVA